MVLRSALANGMDWSDLDDLVKAETANGNPVASLIHELRLDRNRVRADRENFPLHPSNVRELCSKRLGFCVEAEAALERAGRGSLTKVGAILCIHCLADL